MKPVDHYEAPAIERLGSFEELTLGDNKNKAPDLTGKST